MTLSSSNHAINSLKNNLKRVCLIMLSIVGTCNMAKADLHKEDVYQCVIESLFVVHNYGDSKFVELSKPVTLMESLTNLGFRNVSSVASTVFHPVGSEGGFNVKSIKKKFTSDAGISVIVNKATLKKYSDFEVSLTFSTTSDRDEFVKMIKKYGFKPWSDTDPDDYLHYEVAGYESCLNLSVQGKKIEINGSCN